GRCRLPPRLPPRHGPRLCRATDGHSATIAATTTTAAEKRNSDTRISGDAREFLLSVAGALQAARVGVGRRDEFDSRERQPRRPGRCLNLDGSQLTAAESGTDMG